MGRRGSLNAHITVSGVQGHVAYPHRADNPVHPLVAAMAELASARLDEGTANFEPSRLQLTSIDVGNPACNVIPAEARARLNIRFNDRHTGATLSDWLREVIGRHTPRATVDIAISGEAFRAPETFARRVAASVARVTGRAPVLERAAARRTRASSPATHLWPSSGWWGPPCTRPTNAWRWRICGF